MFDDLSSLAGAGAPNPDRLSGAAARVARAAHPGRVGLSEFGTTPAAHDAVDTAGAGDLSRRHGWDVVHAAEEPSIDGRRGFRRGGVWANDTEGASGPAGAPAARAAALGIREAGGLRVRPGAGGERLFVGAGEKRRR